MSLEGKTAEEIQALAELAEQLSSNPKTRMGFLNMTKQANPDAHIPEIDTMHRVGAALKPYLEKIDSLQKRVDEQDLRGRVSAQRREALSVKGVTRDDIPAIEKIMTEKHIPDHKTAAEFHVMQQRAAEPTASTLPGARRTFGAPVMPTKDFNPRAEAYAAIDEMRGRRAA